MTNQTSCTFDSDADVIIVDNSANCIVWKDKRSYIPGTYKSLNTTSSPSIDTAAGPGSAVGIGDINLSWSDDFGKTHQFTLKEIFHIPDSPANILGISAFSKIVGDYESKGTRINSSGQDSVLTWDHGRYQRTFQHSDANMPVLPVNDGFSKFHTFCNFVDRINPIKAQCYHVSKTPENYDGLLYHIGEEVVYQNAAHVEKGIIKRVSYKGDMKIPHYHITFKDNRKITTIADNIRTADETDMATIPTNSKQFIEYSKMLTEDEIKSLQHPLPLTKLEREWIKLHDR